MEDIITQLKAIRIPFESEQSPNGMWSSWPDFAPGLWGEGKDIPASVDDMIAVWREAVELSAQRNEQPTEHDMPYYAKVLISTDEELKSCLVGRIYADS